MNSRFGRFGRNVMLGLAATGILMAAGPAGTQAQGKAPVPGKAAAGKMLEGLSAEEVIGILTEHKIQAQKAPVPDNNPLILAMMPSGAKFFIRLQNCGEKANDCQVVRYGAIFTGADLGAAEFNTFNSRYIFGKAYKDPKNQMYIEHAASVAGGVSRAAVEANMYVFFGMADLFTRFLAERMSSLSASLDQPGDTKSDAIKNVAGDLPANSSLASFRETVQKHPEIINKVSKDSLTAWQTK